MSEPALRSEPLAEVADAVESGAGLPAIARAAARALGQSVAIIDRASTVLAVAAQSTDDESKLLGGDASVEEVELRVAGATVGRLRLRPRESQTQASPELLGVVAALIGLEVERSRSPEWADEAAAADLVHAVLDREVTDRDDIVARAADLGGDLSEGAGALRVRVHPRRPVEGEWRMRVLSLAARAARGVCPGAFAAALPGEHAEVVVIAPAPAPEPLARAAAAVGRELDENLDGFDFVVGHSRHIADPADLHRASSEALLAVNVAEAEGQGLLAFEETGSYRLLLPAMTEDREELVRFFAETVEPLAAYDEQYETELVATVEAFLENDGNVAQTSQQMFTHRHTIRYRLERARELCGHDLGSTEGRERIGLGLKAMRVLGVARPRGPAQEPGSEGGKTPRPEG